MEAVAEPGNDLLAGIAMALDDRGGDRYEIAILAGFGVDLAIELHALLSRAAVDVVEYVDCRRHRAVDWQPAGDRHARDGDRRRVRPMVDTGDHRGLEEVGLSARRQIAAQHQPDHVGKRTRPISSSMG